ncbi:MAG: aldehyde dehydrogenase family protein [Planctomycetes bacterium]|nr:aldehyde dehydrogenase family protein [Planctomycetota bacterium]
MSDRLPVPKTYKLYMGGAFPRTESGRSMVVQQGEQPLAHLCRASRKDFRNAVVAARKAFGGWSARSAYNRGQILYRMAEMLEGKASEFEHALAATVPGGVERARAEVDAAIDRLVCFAGWADKYAQVIGGQNPVEGSFHNFSLPEPTGVIAVMAPNEQPLLGLTSLLAPLLCAGNAVVALGSEAHPLATAILGEVCATSDVPGGVINLLTGQRDELVDHFASHRDVDGISAANVSVEQRRQLELGAAENLKRVRVQTIDEVDWSGAALDGPDGIEAFVEVKTLWHPSAT